MPTQHDHEPGVPCPRCGAEMSPTDRHIRFTWPDALTAPEAEGARTRAWLSGVDAQDSVLLDAPGHGAFVRVLLPVRLDDGGSVTYGAWLGVPAEALGRAYRVWWAPEYADLQLDGRLANDVPPGGALGAAGRALVRDVDHTPYLAESDHPLLARLLTESWPAALHELASDRSG